MTHQQKLEAIREKCIEAGAVKFEIRSSGRKGIIDGRTVPKSLGLADVLRVFTHFSLPDLDLSLVGNPAPGLCGLVMTVKKKSAIWKLDRTLEEQDEPTILFIHSLSCANDMSLERVELQELSDRVRELEIQINSVMKLLIKLCGGDLPKT